MESGKQAEDKKPMVMDPGQRPTMETADSNLWGFSGCLDSVFKCMGFTRGSIITLHVSWPESVLTSFGAPFLTNA